MSDFCRLVALDAMRVPNSCEMEPEYKMDLPPHETYSDLHADSHVPSLTIAAVERFYCTLEEFEPKYMYLSTSGSCDSHQNRMMGFSSLLWCGRKCESPLLMVLTLE